MLKKWYWSMTTGQKIFLYLISACAVLVYGTGLIPLALLIYLQLGGKPDDHS